MRVAGSEMDRARQPDRSSPPFDEREPGPEERSRSRVKSELQYDEITSLEGIASGNAG